MCHHLDEPLDWSAEWAAVERAADEDEEPSDPPEVDLSKPGIGEVEIPEPEIERLELDD